MTPKITSFRESLAAFLSRAKVAINLSTGAHSTSQSPHFVKKPSLIPYKRRSSKLREPTPHWEEAAALLRYMPHHYHDDPVLQLEREGLPIYDVVLEVAPTFPDALSVVESIPSTLSEDSAVISPLPSPTFSIISSNSESSISSMGSIQSLNDRSYDGPKDECQETSDFKTCLVTMPSQKRASVLCPVELELRKTFPQPISLRINAIKDEDVFTSHQSSPDTTPLAPAQNPSSLQQISPPTLLIDDINTPGYNARDLTPEALFRAQWRSAEICAHARLAAKRQELSGRRPPQHVTKSMRHTRTSALGRPGKPSPLRSSWTAGNLIAET